MRIDEDNPKHIFADDGYLLRRIRDKFVFGFEVYLGGDDTIEDFEEIPAIEPEPENTEENGSEQSS